MILRKLDFHYHVWEYSITRISEFIYQTSQAFIDGQISVYLNGLKLEKGVLKDYTEKSDTEIEFNYAIDVEDIVSVEFIKKII